MPGERLRRHPWTAQDGAGNSQRTDSNHRPITLNIEGSRIFGSAGAGCNSYSGNYTGTAGGKFDIGEMSLSATACMPNEIMVQEGNFMKALWTAASCRIAGNKLMLKTDDRNVAAVFRRQSQNLLGTKWNANGIEGISLVSGTSLTLAFGMDGKVSGSAGCNSYFGSYTASTAGKTVSIGPLASTKKLCLKPVMVQEQRFLAALKSAARYRIESGQLTLMNAAGSSAVSLSKP